jgi:hypothetical protein
MQDASFAVFSLSDLAARANVAKEAATNMTQTMIEVVFNVSSQDHS